MKQINKTFVSTLVLMTIFSTLIMVPVRFAQANTVTFTCDASIAADHAGIGSSATFSFTITNTGSAKMGSANITIPAGYTEISSPVVAGGPASQTWTATLIVQPTLLTNGLIVLQGSAEGLSSGQSVSFTFMGVNPSTEGEYNWSVVANQNTGAGGNDYKVTTATAPIYVLDHISINPSWATIIAGNSQSFNVTGYGQNDYSFGDITDYVTWSINSGSGTYTWIDNSVQVTKAGEWTATAQYGDKAASSTLQVTNAGLDHFAVDAPSSAIAGMNFAVNVTAEDQYDNMVVDYAGTVHLASSDPQAVLPDDSALAVTGSFDAILMTIGLQTITATDTLDSSITGTSGFIAVNENTGLPRHMVVTPSSATIVAGDSQTFTVELFDFYGNDLGDVSSSVTWSINSGEGTFVWTGNSVQVAKAGEWTVTAYYSDVPDAQASLIVSGHLPDAVSIEVSPNTWSMKAGASKTFAATASDGYNSWDVTSSATWSIETAAGGSWVQATGTYTSAFVGNWTATASLGSISDTASLTITANENLQDHILITPKTQTIAAGEAQSYAIRAFDQFDNDLGDVTSMAVITATNASVTGNNVSSNLVGTYVVTATYNGLTDSANLTVSGYTVTFKQSGLPAGTIWNINLGGAFYSSTTETITIPDLSAIEYTWTTPNYIQLSQTRFVPGKTEGSITVPSQMIQSLDYSPQYLVTYAVSGNVLSIIVPSNEWVNSGASATGLFLTQVGSIDGKTNCIFVNDDRPSTITRPTTITGIYRSQYLVSYIVIGNSFPISVPPSEWVNVGSEAKGMFVSVITHPLNSGVRCVLIGDNRSLTISSTTTVTASYRTQYAVTFDAKGVESDAFGTLLTVSAEALGYGQLPYVVWVNGGSKLVFGFNGAIASETANKQYVLKGANATSPMLIESPTLIRGAYEPQYSTSLYTVGVFALLLLVLLLLLILLLARRKRKKKEEERGNSLPSAAKA